MRIVNAGDGARLIVARCACGAVLDVADATFAPCGDCAGSSCPRCGGSGEVVDHLRLTWRAPLPSELALL
jgi:hypothetical protein